MITNPSLVLVLMLAREVELKDCKDCDEVEAIRGVVVENEPEIGEPLEIGVAIGVDERMLDTGADENVGEEVHPLQTPG
jgi:hypothetical protein